ncbi:hypothetical protein [Nocardioides caricicola]|uniref:Uncharacterized protein n=1 Tax=Nocardioides caricicola TaxID=634770 RepID=A0ABW0N477_9ACTN
MSTGDHTDDLAQLRQRREAHRAKELAELLQRRPELWGVHLPADLAAEYVLWSA